MQRRCFDAWRSVFFFGTPAVVLRRRLAVRLLSHFFVVRRRHSCLVDRRVLIVRAGASTSCSSAEFQTLRVVAAFLVIATGAKRQSRTAFIVSVATTLTICYRYCRLLLLLLTLLLLLQLVRACLLA